MRSSSWTNPVKDHKCTVLHGPLIRDDGSAVTGLLPNHPFHGGAWRAVCLHCQFASPQAYRCEAEDAARHHEAWAAVHPDHAYPPRALDEHGQPVLDLQPSRPPKPAPREEYALGEDGRRRWYSGR